MIWCMKSENRCKRKGIKVLLALGETLQNKWWKTTKNWIVALVESYRERKCWKLLKKWVWTRETQFLKILYTIFDRLKNKFDRSKMLRLIQHQSSTNRNKQRLTNIFNHNFDRSKNNFDRSKFWKNQFFFFWKTKKNNAETPQSIEFYESHAWVWDEMLFKKTCFKPNFPKIKIFNPFS